MTRLEAIKKRCEAATLIRPVPGYLGYYADHAGSIYTTNSRWGAWRAMKLEINSHGYYRVRVIRQGRRVSTHVHKLVALAWHGEGTKGHQVRHLNGKRLDNRPENLRWGTAKENAQDRIAHGNDKGAINGRLSAHKRIGKFKAECKYGHRMAPNNRLSPSGCRICHNLRAKKYRRQRGLFQA